MIGIDEQKLLYLQQGVDGVPAGDEWLSERERSVLSGMRFTRRRSSWRLGRWTAKLAVANVLDLPVARNIEVLAAADGAPEAYLDGTRLPLGLSISHVQGTCVCAVAPRDAAVGCDVEAVEDRDGVLARDYFTSAEAALVANASVDARALVETLIWSAKESALKALRDGLRRDTRDVEVDVAVDLDVCSAAGGWLPLTVCVRDAADTMTGWWRIDGERVCTLVTGRPLEPHPCPGGHRTTASDASSLLFA